MKIYFNNMIGKLNTQSLDVQTMGELVARVVILLAIFFACSGKLSATSHPFDPATAQASILNTGDVR